ncbi:MAG: hypothetical protein IKE24_01390 [Clostridia bacterium]|nr:hypothetical protein [Clostridia bacterium]
MNRNRMAAALGRIMMILLLAAAVRFPMAAASAGTGELEVTEPAAEETEEETLAAAPEADPAELAMGYIGKTMPHRAVLRVSRPSGLRLAEGDRKLYDALRGLISEVAAGERESTEFSVSYGDVFQNTFTPEELEISAILGEDGKMTEEAKEAALEAMKANRAQLHPGDAVRCLITDLAYELYWYDKSEGHGTKISYATRSYVSEAGGARITVKGEIIVRMSVSEDYAAVSLSEEGEITRAAYQVDPLYGTSVQAAAENAAMILDASQDNSDEEKLEAYRDAICQLTDYNYAAGNDVPYGDPWQLIWVFDGKPNTKVVCEGYAKAFQYLCDLGTAEATAISVQGRTSGAHMWNIVSIRGHQYLADLTNCDLGYDLFMKGYTDGSVEAGYSVRHQYGVMTYIYNDQLSWSEADLTLYSMDYQEWKAKVEKAPAVQSSSDLLFPGYAAVIRLTDEEEDFPVSALLSHRTIRNEAEGTEETVTAYPEEKNGTWLISEPGEYCFSVLRDGAESASSETFLFSVAETAEGGTLRLPPGAEIQTEAFAGVQGIYEIEAENNIFRQGAFSGSGVEKVCLRGDCAVEDGAFDTDAVLCLESGAAWTDAYRFVVKEDDPEET